MREINQTNYHELEFNFEGIIVGIPQVIGFDSELYFIKQQTDYDTDENIYYMSGYNKEDETINGISHDSIPFSLNKVFDNWDEMKYYQFKDLKEFCTFYFHQSNLNNFKSYNTKVEVHTTLPDKEWIHEKCGTNTPPTSIPTKPSVGNKKHNITRREQLKDVIEYLHQYEHVCDLRDKARTGSISMIDYTQAISDLEDWLNEVVK